MQNKQPFRIKTIGEYHRIMDLPKPDHPLISVINLDDITYLPVLDDGPISLVYDFYCISLKRHHPDEVKYGYGQKMYDPEDGVLYFISANQVFSVEISKDAKRSGWLLFFHPDFIWNTSLAKNIKNYDFFDYSVNEALYLSEKEETMMVNIFKFIEQEYHTNIDRFSENVIISQLELLLNYADRFYNRQFLSNKKANHQILEKLEILLSTYFQSANLKQKGLPNVQQISNELNVSANYLSTLLKTLTGQSTQQFIQHKLIEKAKEQLSTTNLTVNEIAYALGFDFPQSFSRLFKSKTNQSPLAFRASFN